MTRQAFPYDFNDLTKMMQDYQVPGVDWQELMASQQKNVEALTRANQVLFEGAQAVIQREVEIMQKAMQEFAEASRDLMQEGDPQAQAQKRLELARTSFEAALRNMRELAELARTSFEAALRNMRELAELAGRSNREALEMINQRAMESFDEIRSAMTQKRQASPPKS